MAKPSTLPRWANLAAPGDLVDPPSGKKDSGWLTGEKPPHSYFNWWKNLVYLWTVYLDGLTGEALTWTAAHVFQAGVTMTRNSGSQTLLVSNAGAGQAIIAQNTGGGTAIAASSANNGAAISGGNTDLGASAAGVQGNSNRYGVWGRMLFGSPQAGGAGVRGDAGDANTFGVLATTASSNGTALSAEGTAGGARAVKATGTGASAVGVEAAADGSSAIAVKATAIASGAQAGKFDNTAGGSAPVVEIQNTAGTGPALLVSTGTDGGYFSNPDTGSGATPLIAETLGTGPAAIFNASGGTNAPAVRITPQNIPASGVQGDTAVKSSGPQAAKLHSWTSAGAWEPVGGNLRTMAGGAVQLNSSASPTFTGSNIASVVANGGASKNVVITFATALSATPYVGSSLEYGIGAGRILRVTLRSTAVVHFQIVDTSGIAIDPTASSDFVINFLAQVI